MRLEVSSWAARVHSHRAFARSTPCSLNPCTYSSANSHFFRHPTPTPIPLPVPLAAFISGFPWLLPLGSHLHHAFLTDGAALGIAFPPTLHLLMIFSFAVPEAVSDRLAALGQGLGHSPDTAGHVYCAHR